MGPILRAPRIYGYTDDPYNTNLPTSDGPIFIPSVSPDSSRPPLSKNDSLERFPSDPNFRTAIPQITLPTQTHSQHTTTGGSQDLWRRSRRSRDQKKTQIQCRGRQKTQGTSSTKHLLGSFQSPRLFSEPLSSFHSRPDRRYRRASTSRHR